MLNALLANDDGIYAPGLAAMEKALRTIANVTVAAPATEQSGVGHSITYLSPLTCKKFLRMIDFAVGLSMARPQIASNWGSRN